MRRRALVAGLCMLLLSPIPLAACLWDSDTLEAETKRIPEGVYTITGRFERNPPLYYEMRLERVAQELESDSSRLELYDDAGVACDQLGRDDEAIGWMKKKAAELDKNEHVEEVMTDQSYRYHANLGTFHVHRWFKNGADRSNVEDMNIGRHHIAKAIEINPDAHFCREKYQLKVIDWILEKPVYDGWLPTFLDGDSRQRIPEAEASEAVAGLTGLIALGNAWESVDVFNALVMPLAIDGQRTSVALLARMRTEELIDRGKTTLVAGAPKGNDLKKDLDWPLYMVKSYTDGTQLQTLYRKLRDEADAWQAKRTAYMMGQMKSGRHPDTDADFWNGYHEGRPPKLAYKQVLTPKARQTSYGFNTPITTVLRVVTSRIGVIVLVCAGVVVWLAFVGVSSRSRRSE